MNFVKASLKNRQVTLTVFLLMFAFGIYSLITMPRREDPKITIPAGLVVAYFPGADITQVEDQVTSKIEEYLFQFEEVRKDKTYSITTEGFTEIHVWLRDNVRKPDIFWSKLRHQLMVIKAVDLPQGVIGPVVNSDFGDTESMIIGISGKTADYNRMKDRLSLLENKLRSIPAVSRLKRIGEQKEQIEVAFRSERLMQYNIDLLQVVKILQSQNVISPTGEVRSGDYTAPLFADVHFRSIDEIRDQIVGSSPTGALIKLKDIADISRIYAEPESKISINGQKALLLAVQMYEGENIVRAGKQVEEYMNEFTSQIPSGMEITIIVNQPEVVRKNISQFLREFFMAIGAVTLVVFLLLPFRIAAVAAAAIPMTVSITLTLLHTFGIELHQVSLASLIAVLGIVVDDAVIIADNYVELLDRGKDRWTAAWQSATELVVPVLTATITIISSFFPLVILTGAIGEFIRALPITVAIALSSSFIVAMILTPLLCYLFIKKGLHFNAGKVKSRKTTFLDLLQSVYNKSIDWCFNHKNFTITASLLTIVLALILFKTGIKQKFFPEAERDQFIVELWMPSGTRLTKTQEAILRIQNTLDGDKRIRSYATFIGISAPRFYYNYSPEMPERNFAQILINTVDKKATESLYRELSEKVDFLVPEGETHVKLMQQGQPMNAHVEVRISGEDISRLKQIGSEVQAIFKKVPGSHLVRSDFKEEVYGINIKIRNEAIRLGFTRSAISQMIYAGLEGYAATKLYEGGNALDIVLRLKEELRDETEDLKNIYLRSPVTGASVPLKQIADLNYKWQPGRIIRRNGLRTLTIQSETTRGLLPSELLKAVKPQIAGISLPEGYRIWYGGEYANQQETYRYMLVALAISLIVIFLVLLFQFRNLKEVGMVMLTIPLSLLGALFGLWITGNDFGFTAFCGIISLSGIEVRNAIILIDHTNELLARGLDIPTAAYEAGKRRLRPIFLTAMAAAIGVFPMILSGSPLWSPLASVIAFGVVWSMMISTLVIPVLYTVAVKPKDKIDIVKNQNDLSGVK